MAKKKKQQNIAGIVITVVAVLLAAAAVIFLIKTLSRTEEEPEPVQTEDPGFIPDHDLISATEEAAYNQLQENYTIYQYLAKGMPVEGEPYGNLPEDGFYTCITDDFADFDAFSEYVHSVFVDEVAEKLLTDPFGNGPVFGYDKEGLGLSVDFTPSEEEGLSWMDVHFICTPTSETECELEVTLKDADGKDVVRKLKLVLEGVTWKLSELVA